MKIIISAVVFFLLILTPVLLRATPKGRVTVFERYNVESAYQPRVLGLFVGISEYRDPFWHDLEFPKKDVQDMVDFFSENKTIRLDDKIVLTTPQETTRDNILNYQLEAFQRKNIDKNDIVIVYFSSHGTLAKELVTVEIDGVRKTAPRKVPYILCSDSQMGKIVESAIPLHSVFDWFNKLVSRRKVLILDMCHSESKGKSQLSPDQADLIRASKGISYIPMSDSQASIILTACPIGGVSFEDKYLRNSIYTHYLLEGMQKGDLNGDGAVTISEAHNYSIEKTQSYSWKRQQYVQTPTAYSKILGRNPIYVSGSPSKIGDPTIFSYASANQGIEVYIDDFFEGMLPKGFTVQPGKHRVECKMDGQTVYDENFEFKPQCDYMLPYFDSALATGNSTCYLMAEGAYHTFDSNDDVDDLFPNSAGVGLSFYYVDAGLDWLAVSGGFDYSLSRDLDLYAFRLGINYSKIIYNTRLFIGPELIYVNLKHPLQPGSATKFISSSSSLCPGFEATIAYTFQSGFSTTFGLRGYYLPYEQDAKDDRVLAGSVFLGTGYSF